jgi:UDP-2,3-diacylglucosamine pyrophosphatase LpxH
MRHTVVISDIHLCELERTDGLWMRYRQPPFSPDPDLAAMLDALRARVRGDALELVLNGDVFDLDAPRVVGGESVFHDQPRNAAHAVPTIEGILADHPVFVAALGRILAEGHTVVVIAGNHDVQLNLPEVRAVLTARLADAAAAADPALPRAEIEARVVFRAWFHRTADGIVVEHGNQYDSYCSYRYPMAPFGRDPREIQPTMGSLCTRNLVGRMGYFNPHVDGSFMLSGLGYLTHWARYYLFSRHSLAFAFARGAVRTVAELVRRRDPGSRVRRRENVLAAARETGAPLGEVARHARLCAPPAEDRMAVVLRELWLDRVTLGALTVLIGLAWFLLAHGPAMAGAAIAPALFAVYEIAVPKPTLEETWRRVQRLARRVARVHKARAVVFGHTHRPEGKWEDGVFYGNTGSWSPAFRDLECTQPVADERPVVWLTSAGGGLTGGLVTWKGGRFEGRDAAA